MAIILFLLLGLAIAVAGTRPSSVRAEGGGPLVAEPVLPASAAGVRTLFGASPGEAQGEVWGWGMNAGGSADIVRYSDAGGWESFPEPTEEDGATPTAMEIPAAATAGRTTPSGGVVTVATLGERPSVGEDDRPQALLVRDQGGQFRAVVPPAEVEETEVESEEGEKPEAEGKETEAEEGEEVFEGVLGKGEQLFGSGQANGVRLAAVEEPSGKTGAFVVPYDGVAPDTRVVHYDGTEWTSEPICIGVLAECEMTPLPAKAIPTGTFKVIAIDATGPGNAWMLAKRPKAGVKRSGEAIILLRREEGQWRKQALGGELGAFYSQEAKQEAVEGSRAFIKVRELGQPLTVTPDGVWVDATIAIGGEKATPTDATIFFDIGEGDPGAGQVTGAWCSLPPATPEPVTAALCTGELPSVLASGEGRSFAWPGTGAPGDFGTRVITGIGKGAILLFENGAFTRIPLAGGGGSTAGAAIAFPEKEGRGTGGIEGWLGPSFRLTREPVPSGLVPWSVPFRRPLTAIAPQPGAAVGELGSQALAVGLGGEVAKYTPGIGWQPESLLTGSETRATPNLRAVAWPVPGFAYAVGDEGAMWIWRSGANRWEADPGAPPNLVRGNFTGIAFDPNEPERGYAVGQQGLLLGYGRGWTQEEIPAEIGPEANITSIAFAGDEAIATWSKGIPPEPGSNALAGLVGGVIVNSGSGWRVEPQATEALVATEGAKAGTVSARLAAGLPDGGAVIAGAGGVIIEREGPGAPWHAVPGAPLGTPVALQAVREGGQLRAIVSVEGETIKAIGDSPQKIEELQGIVEIPEGQAPLLLEPYPPAASGNIVRQTATGWRDEERQSYPIGGAPTDQKAGEGQKDIPKTPAPILAFLVDPDGTTGWAVGGQTGQMAPSGGAFAFEREGLQTAAVMRVGENAAPPENSATVPISVPAGEATFAIGGNAQCADVCSDLSGTGIGPDVWLRAAVGKAAATSGVRAFLYTGSSVSGNLELSKVSRSEFGEEEAAYMRRLGSAAGGLPVFATAAESDRYESSAEPAGSESPLSIFGRKFEAFEQPLGVGVPAPGIVPRTDVDRTAGRYSYSFDSEGTSGGAVRVIVLDYSAASLGVEQECWLAGELAAAKAAEPPRPAIVVGNREAGADVALRQLLVTGANETTAASCPQAGPVGASAYFFDSPQANTTTQLGWGSQTIPALGSGTLGYNPIPNQELNEYGPASGFLLASVNTAALNPVTNVAPVTARLIPSIGSLALNALDGTLVRRSQTALFEALAARPQAGFECGVNQNSEVCTEVEPDPYVQIPTECRTQASCLTEIPPEYRFSSSRPDIANFVKVDPSSSSARAVFLNQEGKPESDPTSGLLCAFNSGTTTVTIEAGGLTYSVPVTVQQGSVARPCGTVPRTDLSPPPVPVTPPPLPAESPPHFETPPGAIPPPPAPQVPAPNPVIPTTPAPTPIPIAHHVPAKPPAPFKPIFFPQTGSLVLNPVIVPPAPPAAAEPAPPTGTSPVTQPAVSPEPEEEEEAAFDLVHHAAAIRHARREAASIAAYRYQPHGSSVPWLLYALPTLVIIAALSTSGIAGRRRRRGPEPAFLKPRR